MIKALKHDRPHDLFARSSGDHLQPRMGDVFNARIAGNIENPYILGSMEFTTKLAGARVVLVMGHSACGAVAGAIADAKLGNLTQLLVKIRPAIKATKYTGDFSPPATGGICRCRGAHKRHPDHGQHQEKQQGDRRSGESRCRQDRRRVLRRTGCRRVLRVS